MTRPRSIYNCSRAVYNLFQSHMCKPRIQTFNFQTNEVLFSSSSTSWNNSNLPLETVLRARFPNATSIKVEDVSGGCGAMFEVSVESQEFDKLNRVKQHKLVTEALKQEIKEMHGIRIFTSTPKKS